MNKFEIEDQNGSIGQETFISFIKTAINVNLPGAGPIINEFLFDLHGRINQNRINEFVKNLGLRIKELELKIDDYSYLKEEAYYDITLKAFESATKANTEEKRTRLARVYTDALFNQDFDFNRYSVYLDFVNRMSELHVAIFKFVKESENELVEIGSYDSYFEKFKEATTLEKFDKYEFKYFNTELENWSLITTGGDLTHFDSTSDFIALESHKSASVKITSVGEKFIKYILD